MTAAELIARLQLDFTPADTGDSEANFMTRLSQIAADAVARPNTTPMQQEAGARYFLLSAQLRQLIRNPDMTRLGDVQESRDSGVRLTELRVELYAARLASGLAPVSGRMRTPSGSALVTVEF